jgi:hypothetical protein
VLQSIARIELLLKTISESPALWNTLNSSFPSIISLSNATDGIAASMLMALLTPTTNSNATIPLILARNAINVLYPSLPSNDFGIVVSVLELSSELVGGINFTLLSTRNRTVTNALSSPVITSDFVRIQLTSVHYGQNGTIDSTSLLPVFETALTIQSPDYSPLSRPKVLHHNCSVGVVESVSMFCTSSRIWLNLTCSGASAAVVRRSCPIPRTVCGVFNMEDRSLVDTDFCEAVGVHNSSVICRCGFDSSFNATSSLLLSQLKGKLSVGAVSAFVSGDIDVTGIVVRTPMSNQVAQQSLFVILTFAGMWICGSGLAFVSYFQQRPAQQSMSATAKYPDDVVQASSLDRVVLVRAYVEAILPVALQRQQGEEWWLDRLWLVVREKHRALRVLLTTLGMRRPHAPSQTISRDLLDIIHLLTSLTKSGLILAMFYDLQSPVDNGYCASQRTEPTCLQRRTALDPSVHLCVWDAAKVETEGAAAMFTESQFGLVLNRNYVSPTTALSDNDRSSPCWMNTHTVTVLSFTVSFVLTSLISIALDFILDALFDILQARERTEPPGHKKTPSIAPLPVVLTDAAHILQKHSEADAEAVLLSEEMVAARMQFLRSCRLVSFTAQPQHAQGVRVKHETLKELLQIFTDRGRPLKQEAYLFEQTIENWFEHEQYVLAGRWRYACLRCWRCMPVPCTSCWRRRQCAELPGKSRFCRHCCGSGWPRPCSSRPSRSPPSTSASLDCCSIRS